MPSGKFNLDSITGDAEMVAAVVPGRDAFGLLNRTLDLPPYWAALLITQDGETRVCTSGGEIDGREVEEIMLLRTTPLHLQYAWPALATKDHYSCSFSLCLILKLILEGSELRAFRESIVGGRRTITIADLQAKFHNELREAVSKFVRGRTAPQLIVDVEQDALLESIRDSMKARLFQSGVQLEGLLDISIDSKSYRQAEHQRVQLERQNEQLLAEQQVHRAVAQAHDAHLTHLNKSLERLQSLAEKSPRASLSDLLRTIDEPHRGELYGVLWSSPAQGAVTESLVVASGRELLFFDPQDPACPTRRVALDTKAGALRSVCHYDDADKTPLLLVGCACGTVIVHGQSGEIRKVCLADPPSEQPARGGFNAVALAGESLFASHSELGLWRWPVDDPAQGAPLLVEMTEAAQAVRHVQFASGRIFLSIDSKVYSITLSGGSPAAYNGSGETISALLCTPEHVYAGNTMGRVLRWPINEPDRVQAVYQGHKRSIESLGRLTSSGVERLCFTDTSSAVHAQVVGDVFTCRYEAGGQTIRRAEFASDWIVGTNETRDRMFCWATHRPADPPTVIAVSKLTGHSIQDVCLLPTTPSKS